MVAVVQAGDATDMIPLLDNNGSGTYNKGRNNKLEFQTQFLGGLVTKNATPFAWKQGILSPSWFTGHTPLDGRVFQQGGGAGSQAVRLLQHRSILTRTGVGPYLFSQATEANVPMPAADGALPRIDLVCMMAYDQGAVPSDAQHGPKYIVVTGDPNASPAIPALPAAVADAMIVARVSRPAADNTIADADITNVRKGVALHGVPRVLFEGDALADAGNYHGEQRLRLGGSFIAADYVNANYTELVDRWDANAVTWRGTQSLVLPRPAIASTASMGGSQTFTLATVSLPDPGWPYRVDVYGSLLYAITGGANTALRDIYLQFNIDSTSFTPAAADLIQRAGITSNRSPDSIKLGGRRSAVLTGAHSVSFIIRNESVPSNFLTWGDNEYASCSVTVHPA
jgi:hypothetical protein